MKKLLCLIFLTLFSCSQQSDTLTIATAANIQYAMKEFSQAFEQETGTATDLVISSSGKLTAQITAGAPYDIFFSADLSYPEKLAQSGLTEGNASTYAYGQLVLWTTIPDKSITLENLETEKRIALGNPKTAPYGKAAEEFLRYMKLIPLVNEKLIFGESISQVNQFITTQNASVGFTSKSSVIANSRFGGQWIAVPDSLYAPIAQAMVVLKNDRNMSASAKAFADYVLSPKGQIILNRFGYK